MINFTEKEFIQAKHRLEEAQARSREKDRKREGIYACCVLVIQLCLTLCDPMDCSLHQAPLSIEFSRQES